MMPPDPTPRSHRKCAVNTIKQMAMTLNKPLIAATIATIPAVVFAEEWDGPYAGVQLRSTNIDVNGAKLDISRHFLSTKPPTF